MPLFKRVFLTVFLMSVGDSCLASQQPEASPEGFLWYKDPALEASLEPQDESTIPATPQTQDVPKTSVEQLEVYKQRFEEAKAKAILNPTLENIAHAQQLHNAIIEQATEFQKMWNLAEMLDVSQVQIPVSPSGARLDRQLKQESLDQDLRALAQSFGLIFAFKPDCPYCHKFAPLVTEFAHRYGFDLQGLSKEEGCFNDMTCSKNPAAMEALNPNGEYPILYLANPKTKDVIPVARGFINSDQLRANMKHAIDYLKSNEGGRS